MKKKLLTGLLVAGLVCGATYQAAANPIFGNEWGNNYCKNGTIHQTHHVYIFWIDFSNEVDTGIACNG
ncbi:hypothetical protein ACFPAF_08955 [Hymenobacter endophyticus]|uniref:Secreted protein n=1 Tax=Hymenobacter endophyticus TaxID=3076335 RepID=A0ABU3TGK5_9BACT|nr:hypothetical protein [Hymenobacter endophyticus]MDU0370517.1 hypothetical protein [Hymenobacter endophyticus]